MKFFCVLLLVLAGQAALAAQAPFTSHPQKIVLQTAKKKYICPALIRIRSIPEGPLFRTDFVVEADLRSIYADLAEIVAGVKKNENGEYVRLYNVTRKFSANQVVIESTADYKREIAGGLLLEQTVHSEVAFTPQYVDGVLRLYCTVLDARLEGIAEQLGLNAKGAVQLIFDLLLRKEMEYRILPEKETVKMTCDILTFTSKDNQFHGFKAKGSAWLSAPQLNHLREVLK